MKAKNKNIENSSGCFQNLKQEDLDFINKHKTQIDYQRGDTIFKQGAFATHVLFVNQGMVRVYLQTARNKQLNIRLAKQGDFMAFSAVFGNEKYQYSAVALTDSSICMIDKGALTQLLLSNNKFALQITSKNNLNESRYLEIIKNVTYKQMRGKLASALLYLSTETFKNENIFLYLSRQEIADFASISLESTVKFLKEFEKEGIIILKNKDIIIENQEYLQDLSAYG